MNRRHLAWTALALLLLSPGLTAQLINPSEESALMEIYSSTGGSGWVNDSGWLVAKDYCTWFGVDCDSTGVVVSLRLGNNNLVGQVPIAVGDLLKLRTLELQSNQLSGSFPAVPFQSLTALNLKDNALQGNLSQFAIPSLVELRLGNSSGFGGNSFPGTLDVLEGMLILRRLDLRGIGISGTFQAVKDLGALVSIDISNNSVSGPLPALDLTNLQSFQARSNQLSGGLPALSSSASTKLRILDLGDNQLSGSVPNLATHSSLQTLTLDRNDFVGPFPILPASIVSVNLSDNGLAGAVPSLNLPSLDQLSADRNALSGSLPSSVGSKLRLLSLEGNRLSGTVPSSVTQLQGLALRYNALLSPGLSGSWVQTQTVAPTGLTLVSATSTTAELQWQPIQYVSNGGGYVVYDLGSGAIVAHTNSKGDAGTTVTGLTPGESYSLAVATRSSSHPANPNALESEPSVPVSFTLPSATFLDAAFEWQPSSPVAGEQIQFEDQSGGGPTSWNWDFGDGSSSNQRNPQHAFAPAGTYVVTLQVGRSSDGASDQLAMLVAVSPAQGLQADFSVAPAQPVAGQLAQFTDQSSASVTDWLWSFGDGGSSTAANPSHVYSEAGIYQVSLTVTNDRTAQEVTTSHQVDVLLDADFSIQSQSPEVGDTVQFVDETFGGAGVWLWSFGDGATSQAQNPSHTYSQAGAFTVQLQVGTAAGSKVVAVEKNISVGNVLFADFDFSPNKPCTGEVVQFVNRSSSSAVEWQWDFGDGSTSSAQNPTHAFSSAGTFDVTLTATDSVGVSEVHTAQIGVEELVADYSYSPTAPRSADQVTFTAGIAASAGGVPSYVWDFGDGGTAIGATVQHAFGNPGDYTVVLTATAGTKSTTVAQVVTVAPAVGQPPTARFVFSPVQPEEGDSIQFSDQSLGSVTSWSWNFGDGTTSTARNPLHSFASRGAFDVELTVTGPDGSATIEKEVRVRPRIQLTAGFSLTPASPEVGEEIRFLDQSSGSPVSWEWTFGDGSTSPLQNPRKSFTQPGTFRVGLAIMDALGSVSTAEISLRIRPVPAEVSFAEPSVVVVEDERPAELVLVRSGSLASATSVEVILIGGTATSGRDYLVGQSQVSWPAFDDSPRTVEVSVLDDAEIERSEFVVFRLAQVLGARVGQQDSTRLVIVDDDLDISQELDLGVQGTNPRVASFSADGRADDDSRQVVVFEGRDARGQGVFSRVFDRDGRARGPATRLDRRGASRGLPRRPQVVFDRRGFFSVVWQEEEASGRGDEAAIGRFFGQIVDPLGVPTTPADVEIVDPEMEVSPPSIDVDNAGEVVIVWREGPRVLREEIDPIGEIKGSNATVAENAENSPQASRSAVGGTMVVWQAGAGAKGSSSFQGGILAQRLLPNGLPAGEPFVVESSSDASNPTVAVDDDGDVVVVWQVREGTENNLVGMLFDPNDQPMGPPFEIPANPGGDEVEPSVDSNSDGDFVVTWDDGDGRPEVALFDQLGRRLGEEFSLGSNSTAAGGVDASIADDDTVQVVYTRTDGRLVSRLIRPALSRACPKSTEALCLREGRFDLRANWRAPNGDIGRGSSARVSDDTGYFTFFDPDNVEVVAKVLDGCAINGRYWFFAAGLTDVEANLVVTDTATGASRNYASPRDTGFEPIVDVNAFGGCEGPTPDGVEAVPGQVRGDFRFEPGMESWEGVTGQFRAHAKSLASSLGTAGVSCGNGTSLCLRGGRFQVEAEWTAGANAGDGVPVQLTSDTGFFTFFDAANVEVVVKVLDGCGVNGAHWVFAGGLTDVGVRLRVTDTVTGQQRTYENGEGVPFRVVSDTGAFGGCSP